MKLSQISDTRHHNMSYGSKSEFVDVVDSGTIVDGWWSSFFAHFSIGILFFIFVVVQFHLCFNPEQSQSPISISSHPYRTVLPNNGKRKLDNAGPAKQQQEQHDGPDPRLHLCRQRLSLRILLPTPLVGQRLLLHRPRQIRHPPPRNHTHRQWLHYWLQ